MFQVGMHVLCVKEFTEPRVYSSEVYPRKGGVYTVRAIENADDRNWLLLDEIVNQVLLYDDGFGEISFNCEAFRPLSSDRLSIFRQHLAPSPTDKVDA